MWPRRLLCFSGTGAVEFISKPGSTGGSAVSGSSQGPGFKPRTRTAFVHCALFSSCFRSVQEHHVPTRRCLNVQRMIEDGVAERNAVGLSCKQIEGHNRSLQDGLSV